MFLAKFMQYFIAAVLTTAAATLCFLAFKAGTATGEVKYCYLEQGQNYPFQYYSLRGFRAWRSDNLLATTRTYEEAVNYAKAIKCRLGVEP